MMPRMKAAWYHRLDIVRGFDKDQRQNLGGSPVNIRDFIRANRN